MPMPTRIPDLHVHLFKARDLPRATTTDAMKADWP